MNWDSKICVYIKNGIVFCLTLLIKTFLFLFIMFLCVCARAAAYTGAGILT